MYTSKWSMWCDHIGPLSFYSTLTRLSEPDGRTGRLLRVMEIINPFKGSDGRNHFQLPLKMFDGRPSCAKPDDCSLRHKRLPFFSFLSSLCCIFPYFSNVPPSFRLSVLSSVPHFSPLSCTLFQTLIFPSSCLSSLLSNVLFWFSHPLTPYVQVFPFLLSLHFHQSLLPFSPFRLSPSFLFRCFL